MKYLWLDACLCAYRGTVKDYKAEWDVNRYMVGTKMYAFIGADNHKRPIITLKGDPDKNLELRAAHADIIPGYYMNKTHWNSVFLLGNVPDDVLREMTVDAYNSILASFSKKALTALGF